MWPPVTSKCCDALLEGEGLLLAHPVGQESSWYSHRPRRSADERRRQRYPRASPGSLRIRSKPDSSTFTGPVMRKNVSRWSAIATSYITSEGVHPCSSAMSISSRPLQCLGLGCYAFSTDAVHHEFGRVPELGTASPPRGISEGSQLAFSVQPGEVDPRLGVREQSRKSFSA